MTLLRTVGLVAGAVLASSLLGACGAADRGDVSDAAQRFYDAVGSGDGSGACGLLAAPTRASLEQSAGEPCAQAVLDEHLPPGAGDLGLQDGVEVHGQMAMVRWARDTTFLARYADGWLVYAAGCTPPPERSAHADRFDCTLQGG
jgi:hypothetical protein